MMTVIWISLPRTISQTHLSTNESNAIDNSTFWGDTFWLLGGQIVMVAHRNCAHGSILLLSLLMASQLGPTQTKHHILCGTWFWMRCQISTGSCGAIWLSRSRPTCSNRKGWPYLMWSWLPIVQHGLPGNSLVLPGNSMVLLGNSLVFAGNSFVLPIF